MFGLSGCVVECGICGRTVSTEHVGRVDALGVDACRECRYPDLEEGLEVEEVFPEAREAAVGPLRFCRDDASDAAYVDR